MLLKTFKTCNKKLWGEYSLDICLTISLILGLATSLPVRANDLNIVATSDSAVSSAPEASANHLSAVQSTNSVDSASKDNGNGNETKDAVTTKVQGSVDAKSEVNSKTVKVTVKSGQELDLNTKTEDLVPTDDVALARQQVVAYPESPEASFILAVALTRTSHVEEALQEVRRAKKLAQSQGGSSYFDKMIGTYEDMLKNYPSENRVRYGLAWAYYMKAYLLAQQSEKIQKWNAAQAALKAKNQVNTSIKPELAKPNNIWDFAGVAAQAAISGDPAKKPHIEGALEKADPSLRGQIKQYYEAALTKLDQLLKQKPDDIWAKVYRAFLKCEYTGNLDEAMNTWHQCQSQAPNNPAPYFFLGEGYLKMGNLKECFNNVSKAIALRSLGN